MIDYEETLALDPDTLDPIDFLHVLPGGAGDGTFERPFSLLTDALADTRYLGGDVDVIYVRSGPQQTVTHTGNFNLVDGTQLLSNGPLQTIATQLGDRELPLSGNDTDKLGLPIIDGQVALGNSTVLSGFEIPVASNSNGVRGTAITDFAIRSNMITIPKTGNAIFLDQIAGTGEITDNMITGAGEDTSLPNSSFLGSGVLVTNSSMFDGTITGNMVTNATADGIALVDSVFDGTIADNELTGGRYGIRVANPDSGKASSFSGSINDNRVAASRMSGISFESTTVLAPAVIRDNSVEQNAFGGIDILDTTFEADILDNVLTGLFAGSAPPPSEISRIFSVDPSTGEVSISVPDVTDVAAGIRAERSAISGDMVGNEISDNGFFGIILDITADGSSLTGDIRNSNISGAKSGIYVQGKSSGTGPDIVSNIVNNVVDANIDDGTADNDGAIGISVNAEAHSFIGDVTDNETNNNLGQGIEFKVANFTGDVARNEAVNNARQDFGPGTANGSAGISFQLPGGDFTGDVVDNLVEGNGRGIIIGEPFDARIRSFTGDVLDNRVNDQTFGGIEILATDEFTGNVSNNTASGNEISILISLANDDTNALTGTLTGNVTNNTINNGDGRAILLFADTINGDITGNVSNSNRVLTDFSPMRNPEGGIGIGANTFNGDIVGNTSNSTTNGAGIALDVKDLNGNIRNNILRDNATHGLLVTNAESFTGDVSGNTAVSNNDSGITIELSQAFTGDILNNSISEDDPSERTQLGIDLKAGSFMGTIIGNETMEIVQQGLRLNLTGTGTSSIDFQMNEFSDTVFGFVSSEVTFQNSGSGTLNLNIENNTAVVPSQSIQYDLKNIGGGTFNVTPAGVNSVNVGTVGSSDGSVVIP